MQESARDATNVLVIGGGVWQCDLIRSVRRQGLRSIVADISPDAPGRALADLFVEHDTNDVDGLCALARAQGVRFVLADQTDRIVPVAAQINERLGLPGIRPDVALRFTDKFAMRNALAGSSVVEMPRYAEVSDLADARRRAEAWGFPVVLKPKQAQASLGVFKVDDPASLGARFPATLAFSRDGHILIEEFVEGPEVTVEALSVDGACHVLAVSEKAHYATNPCVARLLAYPPRFARPVLEKVRSTAARVVEALGLRDGLSHAEYRVRDGVPFLVEVAARGGGNRIASTIVNHVSGLDVYAFLLRRRLGDPSPPPALKARAAILSFFTFGPGRVRAIHGLPEAHAVAAEVSLPFAVGDSIKPPSDDRTRPGYFIVLGEDRDDVDAKARRVEDAVQVEYAAEVPA
jgi:biotin carboxylase